ncbi:DUF1194 domain-containing protein [soil metagenome]
MRWLGALLLILLSAPAHGAEIADLELALAVDASGSVDNDEYRLQLAGIAAGFRDKAVKEAIGSGPLKRIAVSVIIWAEPQVPKDTTGWVIVSSAAEADAFAATVEAMDRHMNGATGIGEGVSWSLRSMEENAITATRGVVDVSGDGRETPPREFVVMMPQARSMARVRGVTINGLAIANEDPSVGKWYEDNVITGPGAFVMQVAKYEDFAEAMRRKLIREIDFQPRLSQRD